MEATASTLTSSAIPDYSESSMDSFDNRTDSPWEDDNVVSTNKRKHNPTDISRRLVTSSKLSSHGAATVGIKIPIHKAIYQEAARVKEYSVSTVYLGKWSMHFDGKHLERINLKKVS